MLARFRTLVRIPYSIDSIRVLRRILREGRFYRPQPLPPGLKRDAMAEVASTAMWRDDPKIA